MRLSLHKEGKPKNIMKKNCRPPQIKKNNNKKIRTKSGIKIKWNKTWRMKLRNKMNKENKTKKNNQKNGNQIWYKNKIK
jgi:lipopolysaccharide export LptBFGC system permease protein LptF